MTGTSAATTKRLDRAVERAMAVLDETDLLQETCTALERAIREVAAVAAVVALEDAVYRDREFSRSLELCRNDAQRALVALREGR